MCRSNYQASGFKEGSSLRAGILHCESPCSFCPYWARCTSSISRDLWLCTGTFLVSSTKPGTQFLVAGHLGSCTAKVPVLSAQPPLISLGTYLLCSVVFHAPSIESGAQLLGGRHLVLCIIAFVVLSNKLRIITFPARCPLCPFVHLTHSSLGGGILHCALLCSCAWYWVWQK